MDSHGDTQKILTVYDTFLFVYENLLTNCSQHQGLNIQKNINS